MLSANVEGGFIRFFFKQRPDQPDWTDDNALTIRIPNNCRIHIKLDPELRWSFRHKFGDKPTDYPEGSVFNDAVTLGHDCRNSYFGLRHLSDQEVFFYAKHIPRKPGAGTDESQQVKHQANATQHGKKAGDLDRDPFNIYVNLDQTVRGNPTKQLAIRIDPDIQNPGDPP